MSDPQIRDQISHIMTALQKIADILQEVQVSQMLLLELHKRQHDED